MLSVVLSASIRMASWSLTTWLSVGLFGLLTGVLMEQFRFHMKRGSLSGPRFIVPFLGSIIEMVLKPYDFWHRLYEAGSLTTASILGQFTIVVNDSAAVRRVFESVSDRLPMILHPNAYCLLGRDNIAFMNGPYHKELRTQLLPLFTQRALSTYLSLQEEHIRTALREWSQLPGPLHMRALIYDLNTLTSMSVFIGPYMSMNDQRDFQNNYAQLTQGMFAFPIYLPGTKLYQGKQARLRILDKLSVVAKQSKDRMRRGEEPRCLIDYWMVDQVKKIDDYESLSDKEKALTERPPHSEDLEIAKVVLDFLFASQDASTASLTWCTHYLSLDNEMRQRIIDEQLHVRADLNASITQQHLAEMKYTWQVMKEILRFRPPATIVPHVTRTSDYEVHNGYVAPRDTVIVPSIWSSNRQGYSEPHKFDPERFNAERREHLSCEKHFLTFGAGPHYCMGRLYAQNHMMLYLALLSTEITVLKRVVSKQVNEIDYLPTIYPRDGCALEEMRHREQVEA